MPQVQPSSTPAALGAMSCSSERRLRVLVVDDNLDQVHSLAFLLKGDGHQVDFAINASAAVDIARKMRPEIVVLDIGLPDGSGLLLAPLLRLIPDLHGVRIIGVTGQDIPEATALGAGFDRLLHKPVGYADLATALASAQ